MDYVALMKTGYNKCMLFYRVRIHQLSEMKELMSIIVLEEERSVDKISWTEDGQLLAVSTPRGNLHVYLTRLPILGDAHNTRISFLTSLLEVRKCARP